MDQNLPGIVVTGASGFIGRHFLKKALGKYRFFCLARRSQKEAGIPPNNNLRWSQVDIVDRDKMLEVVRCINNNGGADYVIHLAAYYDFDNVPNPEYERTNIKGTQNVLDLGKLVGIKRFIFSSSLAACKFPKVGEDINEQSPVDATFPYAWSKRVGEEMITRYTDYFNVTILRLAAIYSDWCEYPPLYMFLKTWLSKKWNAKMLGGNGESAASYLHIYDLVKLLFIIIKKSPTLPKICLYNASPNGSTSHLELYRTATRYYYGRERKSIQVPKPCAVIGMLGRQVIGGVLGNPPFERIWMAKYIDKKLIIDASRTHKELDWQPTIRFDILRRLLLLIENKKTYPEVWNLKNNLALQHVGQRPNLILYDALIKSREALINKILVYLLSPENRNRFPNYQRMAKDTLRWYVTFIYQLVTSLVRSGDRLLIRNYAEIIARQRNLENISLVEVSNAFLAVGNIIAKNLQELPELYKLKHAIYDKINMTFQLAADVVEDYNDRLGVESLELLKNNEKALPGPKNIDLERLLYEFDDICLDISGKEFINKTKQIFGTRNSN